MTLVKKRNGSDVEEFNRQKIYNAIMKAMTHGSGIIREDIATIIANEIEKELSSKAMVSITEDIEPLVFEKLVDNGQKQTARMYEIYRAKRELQRVEYPLDDAIIGITSGKNKEVGEENSNKNQYIAGTQRDLIAGEYSRDYTRRKILPTTITMAHDEGILHYHDMDYAIQEMHNCCLVNLEDMLQNGTVINGKLIEKPKSFQTACTVATQIVQQVANGQYGGQSISIAHLAPFVRISYEKYLLDVYREGELIGVPYTEEQAKTIAKERLKLEIKAGIQTIQYQVNTFSTSNGWW